MFKFISKPNRIKYVADLLPFTNYSKRTTSILPTFQLQPTFNYSSIKHYSSATLQEKRSATEISSNVDHESTVLKKASKLFNSDLSQESSVTSTSNKVTNDTKEKLTGKRKSIKDIVTAVDLNVYRNGNNEDPGFSLAALIKNYFLEKNVSTATTKELLKYIEEYGFYTTKSNPDKKNLRGAITRALSQNPTNYRNQKYGCWMYLKSPVLNPFDMKESQDASKHEDLEYESQIFMPDKDFVWNGKTFELFGYKFSSHRNNNYAYAYALCVDCIRLYKAVNRYNKKTRNQLKIPSFGILRIREDKSVEGCPWKPSNKVHFCHQDFKITNVIKEDKNRLILGKTYLKCFSKFYNELEEIYLSSSPVQFNLDNIDSPLKSFLDRLIKTYPYSSSQKLAFLYFLRYVDNPSQIIYYGVSYDYYQRFCQHEKEDTKFNSEREFEMIVAPLGQNNMLLIKELEALLIRMSKKNLLDDGNSIINISLGHIASENETFNSLDRNDDDFSQDITDVLNQLIFLTLKYGFVIKKSECLTSQIKSVSQKITNARNILKQRSQRLQMFHDSCDKLPVMSNLSFSAAGDINIMQGELISFLCEIEAIHAYTRDQKAAYLYFLKYPNGAAIKRYGITTNPLERYGNHKRMKVLQGENFEMIIAPIGQRSILFVEDLEALLIRFSKMKLLNDGKAVENASADEGTFNSKYNIFQAIVDQVNHPRRPFIIKALNQLIEFTLRSNINVNSFSKSK